MEQLHEVLYLAFPLSRAVQKPLICTKLQVKVTITSSQCSEAKSG